MVHLQHPLRQLRRKNLLTIDELSRQADISVTTIHRVETEKGKYRVNEETAESLAHALGVAVADIFQKDEVSPKGRPPHTGKPLEQQLHHFAGICPGCQMELPRSGICGICPPLEVHLQSA